MSEVFTCVARCGRTDVTKENGCVYRKDKDGNITHMICKECNSCKSRIRNLVKAHPDIEATNESTDYFAFLTKCHGLYGNELLGEIRRHYRATSTDENICQLKGNGKWLDEPDLDAKYAAKPERLAAIKKNARTWKCDIGEVTLYEDMEYETNNSHTLSTKHEREAEVSLNETKLKPPKKPKVAKAAAGQGAAAGSSGADAGDNTPEKPIKKMTEKQVEALKKDMESVKALYDKFTEATKEFKQETQPAGFQCVPQYVHTLIQKVTREKDRLSDEVSATIEADNATAEFGKGTREKIAKLKASIKDVQKRVLIQTREAQSMAEGEGE